MYSAVGIVCEYRKLVMTRKYERKMRSSASRRLCISSSFSPSITTRSATPASRPNSVRYWKYTPALAATGLAADTAENLRKTIFKSGPVVAEIAAPREELIRTWSEVETVLHAAVEVMDGEYHRCLLTPRDGVDLRAVVFKLASERGWTMRELTRGRHTLEDIFIKVTHGDKEDEQF